MKNIQKKSLGQNFLKDKKILKKIADFAQVNKEDIVVEVGPGEGGLTEFILAKARKVIAIEKDEKLVGFLKNKFTKEIGEEKLEIISGDILDTDFKILPKKYSLVGNIPYYITGALFKKSLESENPPKSITFVVQKEVAERIIARDNKESILSISIKAYGTPENGGIIKAGSFNPKPKVDSTIIAIRNINKENFNPSDNKSELDFFEVLKAGFAHKRKLLLRNLDKFNLNKDIFNKCGISEKARAENLSVKDWVSLTKELV